ncbi:Solute carrier family 25 member 39 [Ceratocystis lukuohia]|uniref:Solute carrier family 25 member 39 n=1 Tax=Ceratocystis lukuohia TaxID=2019550 RepID=A0ABR4MT94_9PEZI
MEPRQLHTQSAPLPARKAATTSSNGDTDVITAPQKMISAMSGSLLTSLLVTPLDVVRVRLQSQHLRPPTIDFSKLTLTTSNLGAFQTADLGVTACCREVFFAGNPESCVLPRQSIATATAASAIDEQCVVELAQRTRISSTMDGLRKIAQNEGVSTLWRGLSPTLVMSVPSNIIYFTGYEWLRSDQHSPISRIVHDDWAPLVAGSTARTLAATAVNPIELFRTRLQASSGHSTSGHVIETLRGMQQMLETSGYRSLWRGLTLTLWRDVPFSGIYWWGYETVRGKLVNLRESQRLATQDIDELGRPHRAFQEHGSSSETFTDSFVSGAISGAIASIITTPFDVGKTRTQVFRDGGLKAAKAAKAPEQNSMVKLLWHIFQNEGVSGLWKGWAPRTLKVAPACGIMISSYEVCKLGFRIVNENKTKTVEENNL